MNTYQYTVPGMHCGGCSQTIETAVKSVDPDAVVVANTDDKSVSVKTTADARRVREAIETSGYEVGEAA